MKDRLAALSELLGLTDAQKAQLKPILEAEVKAVLAVRDDASIPMDAKRGKMKAIREENRPKIRAILTPEQSTKLDDWEKSHRGERGDRGPKSPPPPVTP